MLVCVRLAVLGRVAIACAAVLEYMCAEILELSGDLVRRKPKLAVIPGPAVHGAKHSTANAPNDDGDHHDTNCATELQRQVRG